MFSSRSIRCVLAIVVAASTTSLVAAQTAQITDPFPASIERIKHSVAPVICRGPDTVVDTRLTPTLRSVVGTAFFTSATGEFVTAAHVIAAFKTVPGCVPAIYLPTAGWATDTQRFNVRFLNVSRCLLVNDAVDIAICRTDTDLSLEASRVLNIVPVALNTLRQPDGTPLAFTGFPLQAVQPLTSRGYVAAYRRGAELTEGELVVDKTGWPGVSGGPVYIADGSVVGVVLARGVGDNAGVTIARPTSFLRQLLDQARQAQNTLELK